MSQSTTSISEQASLTPVDHLDEPERIALQDDEGWAPESLPELERVHVVVPTNQERYHRAVRNDDEAAFPNAFEFAPDGPFEALARLARGLISHHAPVVDLEESSVEPEVL